MRRASNTLRGKQRVVPAGRAREVRALQFWRRMSCALSALVLLQGAAISKRLRHVHQSEFGSSMTQPPTCATRWGQVTLIRRSPEIRYSRA